MVNASLPQTQKVSSAPEFFFCELLLLYLFVFKHFIGLVVIRLTRVEISPYRPTLITSRAAVGMVIPMGIPMGMGMVWVWGL